jgi:hypothetical protein
MIVAERCLVVFLRRVSSCSDIRPGILPFIWPLKKPGATSRSVQLILLNTLVVLRPFPLNPRRRTAAGTGAPA